MLTSTTSRLAGFGEGAEMTGCDGEPVEGFEPENGKLLHLIVVRTDFTGYQHLHPVRGEDGVWSVTVATPRAGRYRAIMATASLSVVGNALRLRRFGA